MPLINRGSSSNNWGWPPISMILPKTIPPNDLKSFICLLASSKCLSVSLKVGVWDRLWGVSSCMACDFELESWFLSRRESTGPPSFIISPVCISSVSNLMVAISFWNWIIFSNQGGICAQGVLTRLDGGTSSNRRATRWDFPTPPPPVISDLISFRSTFSSMTFSSFSFRSATT